MKSRLWYPQLDIASAARRFLSLLKSWQGGVMTVERLFISDYFVATPALVGDIKMTTELRKKFNDLELPRKRDAFLIYPPAGLLFHSMVPIQKKALVSLVAKGVIDHNQYGIGKIKLTEFGERTASALQAISLDVNEGRAINFVSDLMVAVEFSSKADLRARTGLRYYD